MIFIEIYLVLTAQRIVLLPEFEMLTYSSVLNTPINVYQMFIEFF